MYACVFTRLRMYAFVFPRVSFSWCPEYHLSLYRTPFALSPSLSFTLSVSHFLFSFFPLSFVRLLRNRSRSLALAWLACVNAYPMVNELTVISILERLASPRRPLQHGVAVRSPSGMSLQGYGTRSPTCYLPLQLGIINEQIIAFEDSPIRHDDSRRSSRNARPCVIRHGYYAAIRPALYALDDRMYPDLIDTLRIVDVADNEYRKRERETERERSLPPANTGKDQGFSLFPPLFASV